MDSVDVQEMLDSHNQEMPEQEKDIEELEPLNPVQSGDRVTITPPAATPDQLWQRVEAAWFAVPQEHIQSIGPYWRKTLVIDVHNLHVNPISYHSGSFAMREKKGNHLVPGPDYMVDAFKLQSSSQCFWRVTTDLCGLALS
ncbi:hypothetical protein TNCV_4945281 [Trichonephila clavipes]|nr:hypothetical protein TNCV_4945281 [Trichonephila clavipes]